MLAATIHMLIRLRRLLSLILLPRQPFSSSCRSYALWRDAARCYMLIAFDDSFSAEFFMPMMLIRRRHALL